MVSFREALELRFGEFRAESRLLGIGSNGDPGQGLRGLVVGVRG